LLFVLFCFSFCSPFIFTPQVSLQPSGLSGHSCVYYSKSLLKLNTSSNPDLPLLCRCYPKPMWCVALNGANPWQPHGIGQSSEFITCHTITKVSNDQSCSCPVTKICLRRSCTVYVIKAWQIHQIRWGTTRKSFFENLFQRKASNLHLETFIGTGFLKTDDMAMPRRNWVHQAWDVHYIWRSHTSVTDYVNGTRTFETYLIIVGISGCIMVCVLEFREAVRACAMRPISRLYVHSLVLLFLYVLRGCKLHFVFISYYSIVYSVYMRTVYRSYLSVCLWCSQRQPEI
jgi:hypothetical protein